MKFNEPLPKPPHGDYKIQAFALALFFLVMGVVCALGELGVFRK